MTGLGYSAPWCVNAGFVTGNHSTLIVDTGANALAAATIHGYATAVSPHNKILVINTEKHFDHIGGNSFFKAQGAEIWGHVDTQRTADEFRAEISEFNEGIANSARRHRREAEAFFSGTSLANPDRTTAVDMSFDLGGCVAEILLTPGHTRSNLSVWAAEDRVLYCGDCLINGYLPNLDAGTIEDWRVWLRSLDRIEELQPAAVVAGHGPVATGEEVRWIVDTVRGVLLMAIERGQTPTSPIAQES